MKDKVEMPLFKKGERVKEMHSPIDGKVIEIVCRAKIYREKFEYLVEFHYRTIFGKDKTYKIWKLESELAKYL